MEGNDIYRGRWDDGVDFLDPLGANGSGFAGALSSKIIIRRGAKKFFVGIAKVGWTMAELRNENVAPLYCWFQAKVQRLLHVKSLPTFYYRPVHDFLLVSSALGRTVKDVLRRTSKSFFPSTV